jgi:hypothetical protein
MHTATIAAHRRRYNSGITFNIEDRSTGTLEVSQLELVRFHFRWDFWSPHRSGLGRGEVICLFQQSAQPTVNFSILRQKLSRFLEGSNCRRRLASLPKGFAQIEMRL